MASSIRRADRRGLAPAQTRRRWRAIGRQGTDRLPVAVSAPMVPSDSARAGNSSEMATLDRSVVANVPLFAGFPAEDLDEILREARSVRYPKDSSVFEQGAEAHSFYVLLHGHLRVEKTTPQGQQIVVRYVSAGELFGVAQAMGIKNYPATAIAVVDSVALSWPSTLWPELIAKFPA